MTITIFVGPRVVWAVCMDLNIFKNVKNLIQIFTIFFAPLKCRIKSTLKAYADKLEHRFFRMTDEVMAIAEMLLFCLYFLHLESFCFDVV